MSSPVRASRLLATAAFRGLAQAVVLVAAIAPPSISASVLAGIPAPLEPAGLHLASTRTVPLHLPPWHRVHNAAGVDLPRLMPVDHARVTSGFGLRRDPFRHHGKFHEGVDFAGRVGTPIHAVGDGVVVDASFHRDYGNVVVIDHGTGLVTLYAHASRLEVQRGDVVLAGQEIARVGSTGRSTGPHLHFEVRRDGERIDPQGALAAQVLRRSAGVSS